MSNSVTATASPEGVTLSFAANGATPPSTVTLMIDGRHSFEGCAATREGNRLLVHVPREQALKIDAGTEVEVSVAGLDGEVEWPVLPPSRSGAGRIGAKVEDVTTTPANLKGDLPDTDALVLPPKSSSPPPPHRPADAGTLSGTAVPPVTSSVTSTGTTTGLSETVTVTQDKTKRRGIFAIIAGSLVLLLLIAALLWFFMFRHKHIPAPLPTPQAAHDATAPSEPPAALPPPADIPPPSSAPNPPAAVPVPASAPPAVPPVAPSGTAADTAPGNLATLAVPDVVQQAPNAAAIGAEGERRLNGGKPDDGLRLMEAASDRGDTHAMETLGRMYDPAHFKSGGPIPSADEQEAARYYQQAAKAGDTSITDDRAKLQASLKQRADDGDSDAAMTLESYFK